jgi:hypothetical protein
MEESSMRSTALLLVAFAIAMAPFAKLNADVYARDPKATHYVRVTPVEGLVRFELCDVGNTDCKLLGKRNYSLYELKALQKSLLIKGTTVLALDSALAGASLVYGLGGGVVLALYLGVAPASAWVYVWAYGGAVAGAHSAGHLMMRIRALNPIRRYREARAIRKKVVTDADARVWNVQNFAGRLNAALLLLN